jgi:hypothetical protein
MSLWNFVPQSVLRFDNRMLVDSTLAAFYKLNNLNFFFQILQESVDPVDPYTKFATRRLQRGLDPKPIRFMTDLLKTLMKILSKESTVS